MDTAPLPQGQHAEPDAAHASALSSRQWRRQDLIATGIIASLMLSVFLVLIVVSAMTSASASVTGGCGGG